MRAVLLVETPCLRKESRCAAWETWQGPLFRETQGELLEDNHA